MTWQIATEVTHYLDRKLNGIRVPLKMLQTNFRSVLQYSADNKAVNVIKNLDC